jgi:mono/diheme cytochrome c family protein
MRALTALVAVLSLAGAARAQTVVERGKYLVTIAGCNDCHTPGGMLGQPDAKRLLAGSDVGFGDPASGVWIGGNLTPDMETGLGKWTTWQIMAAITTGETPEGRKLSEMMPYPAFSHLTPADAAAIAAYLQSLPPVKNAVPGPYKAGEAPAVPYVSAVIPTAQYMGLPRPK